MRLWPRREVQIRAAAQTRHCQPAPAGLPKSGSGFDPPVAVARLTAFGHVSRVGLDGAGFVGELGLDGYVRPVRGAIALAMSCLQVGLRDRPSAGRRGQARQAARFGNRRALNALMPPDQGMKICRLTPRSAKLMNGGDSAICPLCADSPPNLRGCSHDRRPPQGRRISESLM